MTSVSGPGNLNLSSIPSYPLENDVLDIDLANVVFPESGAFLVLSVSHLRPGETTQRKACLLLP